MMALPLLDDDDPQDPGNDGGVDLLDEVSLTSFTATPAAIQPFGASVLSWSVKAPKAVRVKLNGLTVSQTGSQTAQPAATTTYRLSAHAGQASRTLGTVQVTVDRSTCESWEFNNPRATLESPVKASINNDEELYFSTVLGLPALVISFSPGRIRLQLRLKKSQDWFPDPSIYIDASFGLQVQDGRLEPSAAQVSVDISVPWYAWAAPGAIPALAIAIEFAREGAIVRMHQTIQQLCQLLTATAFPPSGKRISTVRVDAGNNGAGVIELTGCSIDLLKKLAEISEVVILQ
jgi:hypothetical protein